MQRTLSTFAVLLLGAAAISVPQAAGQVFKSRTSVTVLKEAPAKPKDAVIERLATEPRDREWEELCMITATGGQTIFNAKKGSTLYDKIEKDARQCGADAIIIRSSEDRTVKPLRGGIDQSAKAQAVAIRYK